MPYILYKTNGNKLVTVNDATVDSSTSLSFVGRNYSGYGDHIDQNFLYLLENFTNTAAPAKPVQGQLWFDNTLDNRRLNVCYDGKNFKGIASITVGQAPFGLTTGDFWWDTVKQQLSVYNNGTTVVIGPQTSATDRTSWKYILADSPDVTVQYPILESVSDYSVTSMISDETFTPVNQPTAFPLIHAGITLPGADPETGSSQKSDGTKEYLLWGTAADAKIATTSTTVAVNATVSPNKFYVPMLSGADTSPIYSTSSFWIQNGVLNATATSARYADLAERYHADAVYEAGTVLVLGGEHEVTVTAQHADTRVAGIVSTTPAYMMNSDAGPDDTHPYIALRGRVPCKVWGPVNSGDLLVSSAIKGFATAAFQTDSSHAVVAKAIGKNAQGPAVIEVLVM